MPFTKFISDILPPLHLLAYSTLIGAELYQTIVVTKIAFRTLPKPSFVGFQKQIFPVYFETQSALLLIVAITSPPYGPVSSSKEAANWIPFVIAGVTAALNLTVYGPRTKVLMIERALKANRDGKLKSDSATKNQDMAVVDKLFSRAHAMSIHLNLITIGATLFYGWRLALKLQFHRD